MIIVRLQGGLGNQLFEYALGRSLALRYGVPLKLDTRWYAKITDRQYGLAPFAIAAELATPAEIRRFVGILPDTLRRRLQFANPHRVVTRPDSEYAVPFDTSIFQTGPDVYLEGCWQSEKYFNEYAAQIRQDLTLKVAATGENRRILEEIEKAKEETVSLHVRRGDYVTNPVANSLLGTCSLEYYQAAVEHIAKQCKQPHFYVFSDDPEWTKANLKIDHPTTYVTNNGDAPEEDLRLMRACCHFIIANSSFSWWGAWLGSHPKKMVIAPQRWFSGGAENPDLIPPSWVRL